MEFEIVELKEKKTVGLTARTNNQSPDMGAVIGGLWGQFYETGIHARIQHKTNDKAIGIYSDYADDEKGDYNITVACEVDPVDALPEHTVVTTIPAGRYARFIIRGHMQQAVAQFWQQLWEMKLDRTFICDFEEYQNASVEQAEIHIYIGIR